jgi:hypothetical protein
MTSLAARVVSGYCRNCQRLFPLMRDGRCGHCHDAAMDGAACERDALRAWIRPQPRFDGVLAWLDARGRASDRG